MVDMEAGSGARGDEPGLVSVQGRQGNVSFRPYRDIKTRAVTSHQEEVEEEDEEGEEISVRVDMVEVLYPEILCHLFSFLDTQSKGRAAQVNIRFLQLVLSDDQYLW